MYVYMGRLGISQCGPQNLNTEGMHMIKNGNHTYFGIDYNTIFYQKCNYCGVLSSFWRDEGCFKALCRGFSDSFEGFHSLQKRPSDFAGISVGMRLHCRYNTIPPCKARIIMNGVDDPVAPKADLIGRLAISHLQMLSKLSYCKQGWISDIAMLIFDT